MYIGKNMHVHIHKHKHALPFLLVAFTCLLQMCNCKTDCSWKGQKYHKRDKDLTRAKKDNKKSKVKDEGNKCE